LAKEVLRYTSNTALYNVTWNFVKFPNQTFKNNFGAALLQYAQGTMTWDAVKKLVIDQWAIESAKGS
jgi:raffinose/stachyose/melibiose transport system substrate-binding protein